MDGPSTEQVDPTAAAVSDPEQLWQLFEQQESTVQRALSGAREGILELSERMARTLDGETGRVIGLGAGTSGRLLALDMAEWGPTFSIATDRRLALIAGGDAALTAAQEDAEDDGAAARDRIAEVATGAGDLVIGISASGSAAWVREGLTAAAEASADTVFITCDPDAAIGSSLRIVLDTGAEPVAGSTRLKAATATHRLLQRASTICALRNGWIHRGLMVALTASNRKLRNRAVQIVMHLASVDKTTANESISRCHGDLRHAIATCWADGDVKLAARRLTASGGHLGPLEREFGVSEPQN